MIAWIAGALGTATLLAVVVWVLARFAGKWIDLAADRAFGRVFRRRVRAEGRQLRRYRKAVEANYGKHALGFFRTKPIDIRDVYVPLQYENGDRRQDVYQRIRDERRTVVVGQAGAGKSLLLKHSMLIWAAAEPGRQAELPVLVDLHRCNTGRAGLLDLAVAELRHLNRRPDAVRAFVTNALHEGQLRLLFDGLDEVGRDYRDRVVRELRDLARDYPKCQLVVTCRSAVYHGQLAPEFEHVVQIADFDDAGIRRLLRNWPGIAEAGGVDRLYGMLRKNRPLMRLARSPLLLTMMAYLHVDAFTKTGRTLPNSRAEFYDTAITHLLGRDVDLGRREGLTVYHVGEKLPALQRIALALQETPPDRSADRLSMSRTQLLALVGETLPELNLDTGHARPLLEEIVDRSQLLVPLDRRDWLYQFRHLTMQEYLAAQELVNAPERLLANYEADPDAWRETVKLWCASGRDCTTVVAEVFANPDPRHKVLALECLADARRISPVLADQIIEHFLAALADPAQDAVPIVRAFGAVAADARPRGNKVLELLVAVPAFHLEQRDAAFRALAASGRAEAARALTPLAADDPAARAALREMGELAIPALVEHATGGDLWAVDDLAAIATPAAAEALQPLLWNDGDTAIRAAWWLAQLLRDPDIEDTLAGLAQPLLVTAGFTPAQPWWAWDPFLADSTNELHAVVARTASLMFSSSAELIPDGVDGVDTRIALPVITADLERRPPTYDPDWENADRELLELIRDVQAEQTGVRGKAGEIDWSDVRKCYERAVETERRGLAVARLVHAVLQRAEHISAASKRLVALLNWPVRARVIWLFVISNVRPTRRAWLAVRQPQRDTKPLWVMCAIASIGVTLAVLGITGYRDIVTVTGSWPFGPPWLAWASLVGLALTVLVGLSVLIQDTALGERISEFIDDAFDAVLDTAIGVLVILAFAGHAMVTAAFTVAGWTSWSWFAGIVAVAAVLIATPAVVANAWEKSNENPLRECLEADRTVLLGRRSIIAGRTDD